MRPGHCARKPLLDDRQRPRQGGPVPGPQPFDELPRRGHGVKLDGDDLGDAVDAVLEDPLDPGDQGESDPVE